MKGTEILKWGLGLWISYKMLKEIDSISQAPSSNLEPSPRNILANLDIKGILEEAFNKTFGKPTLLEPQPQPVKLVLDPQTVEAGNWLKLIHHPSVTVTVILGGGGER